jgi:hypothetical protein
MSNTDTSIARLALDHSASPRSDNDCCTTSSSGHTYYWNQFCSFSTEKAEYILYQSTEVSYRES